MIDKIKNSLAFRLPLLYKALLNTKKIKKAQAKEALGATVITMTGKKIITMTRCSILSIARSWERLPRLIVVSDGTITAREIEEKLAFWQGELIVHGWEHTANYHLVKKRDKLIKYAGEHVLGKKMAVILHHAEIYPITWFDSDILFFSDFSAMLPPDSPTEFVCGGSADHWPTYDPRVLKHYNNDLYKVYQFSSGLLYIYGEELYERFGIDDLLPELNNYVDFFTEQTIFAHIASKSLGILWGLDIIKNFNDDSQSLKPMQVNNVIGRHYTTNVRHLFWRDAFYHLS